MNELRTPRNGLKYRFKPSGCGFKPNRVDIMDLKSRVSSVIIEIIKQRNLSNIKVGRVLGVDKNTVDSYRRMVRTPSAGFVEKLCAEYDVNPSWIISGKGSKYHVQELVDYEDGHNRVSESFKEFGGSVEVDPKGEQALSVIGRLLDKNDRLELKIDDLEEELKRYRQADAHSVGKKTGSAWPDTPK